MLLQHQYLYHLNSNGISVIINPKINDESLIQYIACCIPIPASDGCMNADIVNAHIGTFLLIMLTVWRMSVAHLCQKYRLSWC